MKNQTSKATTKVTSNKTKQTRKPKAVTLLVYLTEYMADNDITADTKIDAVIMRLEGSIVEEAKAKMRS